MRVSEAAVLGAGSFGTALAELLARQGIGVRLWFRDADNAAEMNRTHKNPKYLRDFTLSSEIEGTASIEEAVTSSQLVVVAVPSQVVRPTLRSIEKRLPKVPLLLAAKGIENDSLMTMAEVVVDVLGPEAQNRVAVLSGPSFAQEIVRGYPTAVVVASQPEGLAQEISQLLFSDSFRAYSSADVVGVELGGALKNVLAIASGATTGLGLGDNTRAALLTRGLAEITRLAVAKGAHPMTLAGLAGVGDLVLTCTGALSRNRALGQALGEGKTLEQAIAQVREVAEGVRTTLSAYKLAQKLKVEAPIIEAIYKVLYENIPVKRAITALVRRQPKSELEYD